MPNQNQIKVKKVFSGYYKVYDKETNQFLGEIDQHATSTGEWVARDQNNDWMGTCSTKKQAVSWFK
jgi:hypothetical protein